jgi:hypothetical protein
MRASRFSEEQIIGILREQERGAKTAEVCRLYLPKTPNARKTLEFYEAAP